MTKRKHPETRPRKPVAGLKPMWDEALNGRPFPNFLPAGSGKKYHWFHVSDCGCTHRWFSSVATMTLPTSGIGCGICTGKDPKAKPCCVARSLAGHPNFPKISDKWDYAQNPKQPSEYYPNTTQKVWWFHVSDCGCTHRWFSCISSMIRTSTGIGCATCTGKSIYAKPCCVAKSLAGHPSFQEISEEWDYSKNPKNPSEYYPNCNEKVWWVHTSDKCGCIHNWKAPISARISGGKGCPICSKHFSVEPCCTNETVSSDEQLMKCWNWEKNKHLDPTKIGIGTHKVASWICTNTCANQPDCKHEWDAEICSRKTRGCPYHHTTALAPCCLSKSLASPLYADIVKQFDPLATDNPDPRSVYPASGVTTVHWLCVQSECGCEHRWSTLLSSRVSPGNPNPLTGCPYCCKPCKKVCCADHPSSLMQWTDKAKLRSVILGPPNTFESIERLCISAHEKIWFHCDECSHNFDASVSNVTQPAVCTWCPYCSHSKLCEDDECKFCFTNSLASWTDADKLQSFHNGGNPVAARRIMKHSGDFYKFKCFRCDHIFRSAPHAVTSEDNPKWCIFCANKKQCGEPNCNKCKRKCEDGSCNRRARTQTRVTRRWYCEEHFTSCIRHDPKETPICTRAKVSLEMFMLAELQRMAYISNWEFPTTWDCPIYPGLDYKPDIVFIFDKQGNLLEYCGAHKINADEIGYILQVEIIEKSRKAHSAARTPCDEVREEEIRGTFPTVPMGVLYVTVAHTKHSANPEDVFFQKVGTEYELIPGRELAFESRMTDVCNTLTEMFEKRENGTRYIGN